MRISDWSSDVCSSDLPRAEDAKGGDRILQAVGHHDRDAIALLELQLAQQVGGELAAELVDLAVGECLAHVGEVGAVSELADRALEHGRDRDELCGIDLIRNASGIMAQPGAHDRPPAFPPMFTCPPR